MNATLDEQVRDVIAAMFNLDPQDVGDDSSAQTVPGWTSLAHLTLMLRLEEIFKQQFTMDEMNAMTSVAAIVDTLAARGV